MMTSSSITNHAAYTKCQLQRLPFTTLQSIDFVDRLRVFESRQRILDDLITDYGIVIIESID